MASARLRCPSEKYMPVGHRGLGSLPAPCPLRRFLSSSPLSALSCQGSPGNNWSTEERDEQKGGRGANKKKKGALSDYVFDEWKIVIYQLQTNECEGRPPGSKRTAVMCCSRLSDRPKLECFAVFYRVVVQKWRGTFGCRIQLCQVHRLQNVQP